MSRHLIPRALLAASLVVAAAAVSSAEGDHHWDWNNPENRKDNIPKADVPGQLQGGFDEIKSRHSDLSGNVDRFQTNFDKAFGNIKTDNYSKNDVHLIEMMSRHLFEHAADYQKILGDSNLSADQKLDMLNQLRDKADHQRQADFALANKHGAVGAAAFMDSGRHDNAAGKAAANDNGKGDANQNRPEQDQDFKNIHKAVAEAAQQSFSPQDGNPVGNLPSAPTLGQVLGAPPNPNDSSSMMAAVGDNIMKGSMSDAMQAADRAVELGGGAPALALRGGLELDQKQYSRAGQDAQQALQLDPANKDAAAIAHFAEGRSDGIASDGPSAAKAGEAGPGGGGAGGFGAGSGGGYSGSGSMGSGAAGGSAAERIGGVSGSLGLSRGGPSGAALAGMSGEQARKAAQDALALGDVAGAMSYANRAIAQDPKNAGLYGIRSQIYARQRDYARAAADARLGLALAPKDPALLRALGFAQLRDKDYNGALATANMMLELNPNDPYAYALRAHAYGSLGDRDAMMADLKRAAELDPSFRDAAAQMSGQLQLPTDKDILFLFPGEQGAAAAAKPSAPAGRGRLFGLLVGAAALGGLLLALGLLHTVLAPLKDKVTSAFTRITRTGPTVGAEVDNDTAQPASVNGLLPGLIRGQYEILRQIGQGGMGTVFEGTDRSLGRRVAVKKMRDELRVNPAERARFVIEAKTVAALHHPNIVDIYAIAEEGPDVYLVFEYVDGKTVHELVQSAGRLPVADAARVVRASADALGYAHSRGVIHRDMKPSNVMVDGSGRVKVMDFGIARMAKDSMTRFSMTNTVVGTPPYMAPEQEQGHVRRESDVYALAVCAYEMLTGKLPFVGIGAGMLMNKINMSFIPPSRATAGLPEALDEVFTKAFQADPERRYRAPAEFADALTAALPGGVRAS